MTERLGKLPAPNLQAAHDVRHLVVCAYARCRQLGDERHMVPARAMSFQSSSDGKAYYHGRCYVRAFSLKSLLACPKRVLARLTLGDVGVKTMKAIVAKVGRG